MIALLIRLASIVLVSAAMYLLASLVQQQRNSKPTARRPYRPATSTRRSPESATYKSQSVVNSRVRVPTNQELEKEKQLLSRLGGNRATAIRLLKHTYQNNPDRSYQWCLEKTISDLLRDRRS